MKYVKSPGQVYDLFKLFCYHFNKSILDKIIEDPEDYEQTHLAVLNGETINEDLYLFFYSPDGMTRFLAQKDLSGTSNDLLSENLFARICEDIANSNLFNDLLRYYSADEILENTENFTSEQVYKLVKNFDIPDKIKLQIVHFSMNKSYYKELLIKELKEKFVLVEKYFQRVKMKIEYVQRLIDTESQSIEVLDSLSIAYTPGEVIHCSVSATEDKMAIVYSDGVNRCLVIGYGTIDKLQEMLGSRAFDMFLVAKALADTLRIGIVNMVKERGEMNTTEIANTFGKGLTAVFYHLNMLAEAKILHTRSRGRTVLYSVNNELFNNFSVFVKDFAVNRATRL